jgi:hypothetical protein
MLSGIFWSARSFSLVGFFGSVSTPTLESSSFQIVGSRYSAGHFIAHVSSFFSLRVQHAIMAHNVSVLPKAGYSAFRQPIPKPINDLKVEGKNQCLIEVRRPDS